MELQTPRLASGIPESSSIDRAVRGKQDDFPVNYDMLHPFLTFHNLKKPYDDKINMA